MPVEELEDEGVVDLARARLVAAGIVGDLDVRDPIAMCFSIVVARSPSMICMW